MAADNATHLIGLSATAAPEQAKRIILRLPQFATNSGHKQGF